MNLPTAMGRDRVFDEILVDFEAAILEINAETVQASLTDDPLTQFEKAYWQNHFSPLQTNSPRRLDAVKRQSVSDGSSTFAVTQFAYDDAYTKGNVTEKRQWNSAAASSNPPATLDVSNSIVVLSRLYDSQGYGNLRTLSNRKFARRWSMTPLQPCPRRSPTPTGRRKPAPGCTTGVRGTAPQFDGTRIRRACNRLFGIS